MTTATAAMCMGAVCYADNGDTVGAGGKGPKPTFATWVYPEDGGAGKIIDLAIGAKAPKGYSFEPSDKKPEPAAADDGALSDKVAEQAKEIETLKADAKTAADELKSAQDAAHAAEKTIDDLQQTLADREAQEGDALAEIKRLTAELETATAPSKKADAKKGKG